MVQVFINDKEILRSAQDDKNNVRRVILSVCEESLLGKTTTAEDSVLLPLAVTLRQNTQIHIYAPTAVLVRSSYFRYPSFTACMKMISLDMVLLRHAK